MPDHSRSWKWSWWMWKSCSSVERFSMIQSSTSPCLTTMSGTSDRGSNGFGVSPSTVRKNLVGLLGSFGLAGCSEKNSFRTRTGATSPSQGETAAAAARRCAGKRRLRFGRIGRGRDRDERAIRIVLAGRAGVDRARHQQRGHAERRTFDDELDAGAGRHADVIDPLRPEVPGCRWKWIGTPSMATMPSGCGTRRTAARDSR